ncbi:MULTISPECIES: VOC family protein [Nocardioides]|uniref:VOC family protein n=1 Tax=Nocardioides kribbensis TaxID=305517 RepID=A0ABV1P1S7_9ACTN|nr:MULTISPECIES: VOC family protein [unclassified Nocardioides]KQQ39422.1 glyoxalase [Nocardioides sp. Leaf307]
MTTPTFRLASTVLGARDPEALAAFYVALLGWRHRDSAQERAADPGWVVVKPVGPDGAVDPAAAGLAFQREDDHVPPTWPPAPGAQQMQAHLDVAVDDLAAAVARALELGAVLAPHQPQDLVRVVLDPEGHPLCLFAPGG